MALPEMHDAPYEPVFPFTGAGVNGAGRDEHEHVDEFKPESKGFELDCDLDAIK